MGMPATGKSVETRAVMVITEEGGKIVRMRHNLDVAGMMAQLGMAPGGPPRAA
jgi:predicted ester cyclase